MKQLLIFLFLIAVTTMGKSQDTLFLRDGICCQGRIISLTNDTISIQTANQIKIYTATELAGIYFAPAANLYTDSNKVITERMTTIYFQKNNSEPGNGTVVFSCKECGINHETYKGAITIVSSNDDKTIITQLFSYNSASYMFTYKVNLTAGNYTWHYNDNRNNMQQGVLNISEGANIKALIF
jgi:hypothetical protein